MRKQPQTSDLQHWRLIGERIRKKREAIGMTQTGLAELVGTSDDTISRVERGRANDVSFLLICKICKALEVSLVFLCPAGLRTEKIRVLDPQKAHDNADRLFEIVKEAEQLITRDA